MGGDSGPAIEPKHADKSLLISAIEYESMEMPPAGRLPADVVEKFRQWIDDGAYDPRTDTAAAIKPKGIDIEAGRSFWAFQKPVETSPPVVPGSTWAWTEIDRFVEAKRLEAGLPSPGDAEPIVSLRRLCFDLTGLPPSPDLIRAYSADPTPQRWRAIVDQLIGSPAYAEHWGRQWLDVARYADSNGGDFNATFHDAWRYRWFVIDSMASDKPFNQFVRQQIAGDLLPAESDAQRTDNLVATGFLMMGPKMLSERDKDKLKMDVVDDQIDTVGRAFLGMTLGCARCHDHKFDPIPTEDYYALAGIFASTKVLDGESQRYVSTWVKRELPVESKHLAAFEAHQAATKQLDQQLAQAKKQLDAARNASTDQWGGTIVDDQQAEKEGGWKESTYSPKFVGSGYVHDENSNKGKASITFTAKLETGSYDVRLAYIGSGNRASRVPVEVHTAEGVKRVILDQSKPGSIEGLWESIGEFAFDAKQPAKVVVRNDDTEGYVIADAVQFIQPGEVSVKKVDSTDTNNAIAEAERRVKEIEAELKSHALSAPDPLPQAMAVVDEKEVDDACLCIRGEVHNKGPSVPRGFLQVVSNSSAIAIPEDQSGRLQLADWLTDPDNPLTARVIVNRVWMHLLGEGIVRSVDNFGELGDRPSHPKLLDTLSVQFVREGWSIKALVRKIVLSRVYQQSANFNPAAFNQDPDNRLLWRANRKRLPAEALRDTMLVASGQLDRTPSTHVMNDFGVLVNNNDATSQAAQLRQSSRRSMYLQIIRGQLPAVLATFDFADPDILVGKRPTTNVPSQALLMLNSPLITELSSRIAERISRQTSVPDQQIETAMLLCLQRFPASDERELAKAFIGDDPTRFAQFIQALLAGTEYRYLD
ncbi:MAG: DUF1553 domain-containing protein [Pirellulaceae bacterium]